jgi:hypothetical protein
VKYNDGGQDRWGGHVGQALRRSRPDNRPATEQPTDEFKALRLYVTIPCAQDTLGELKLSDNQLGIMEEVQQRLSAARAPHLGGVEYKDSND